jgi:serralysin
VIVVFNNGAFTQHAALAVSKVVVNGFAGDDDIYCGDLLLTKSAEIRGGAGSDYITGTFNADRIYGGEGTTDPAKESEGDTIYGMFGNDVITASFYGLNTFVSGELGDDMIIGYHGNDTLEGNEGEDKIWGGTNADTIYGGDNADEIHGDMGDDVLFGEGGSDKIWGDLGNDTIHGGKGNDTLRGGFGDDAIFGDDDNDKLYGEAGNDLLNGGPGSDTLEQ